MKIRTPSSLHSQRGLQNNVWQQERLIFPKVLVIINQNVTLLSLLILLEEMTLEEAIVLKLALKRSQLGLEPKVEGQYLAHKRLRLVNNKGQVTVRMPRNNTREVGLSLIDVFHHAEETLWEDIGSQIMLQGSRQGNGIHGWCWILGKTDRGGGDNDSGTLLLHLKK